MPRIGLIQSGGIGDLIIALPIADYFREHGCEVVWPIRERLVPAFVDAAPEVKFLPVPPAANGENYHIPLELLKQSQVDQGFCLYNHIGAVGVCDDLLASYLKFDEYKYAITRVPFERKWHLKVRRNAERERALHASLGIERPYICVHSVGSNLEATVDLPAAWSEEFQVVRISAVTENPFDWIHTLENASKLVLIDSCFANLVEGLNLPNEKYLVLRTPGLYTPVFRNAWGRLVPFTGEDGKVRFRLV